MKMLRKIVALRRIRRRLTITFMFSILALVAVDTIAPRGGPTSVEVVVQGAE